MPVDWDDPPGTKSVPEEDYSELTKEINTRLKSKFETQQAEFITEFNHDFTHETMSRAYALLETSPELSKFNEQWMHNTGTQRMSPYHKSKSEAMEWSLQFMGNIAIQRLTQLYARQIQHEVKREECAIDADEHCNMIWVDRWVQKPGIFEDARNRIDSNADTKFDIVSFQIYDQVRNLLFDGVDLDTEIVDTLIKKSGRKTNFGPGLKDWIYPTTKEIVNQIEIPEIIKMQNPIEIKEGSESFVRDQNTIYVPELQSQSLGLQQLMDDNSFSTQIEPNQEIDVSLEKLNVGVKPQTQPWTIQLPNLMEPLVFFQSLR